MRIQCGVEMGIFTSPSKAISIVPSITLSRFLLPYITSSIPSLYWKMTMPDFTLLIPSEIFSDILSHIKQVDSIECMTVCRRWYNLIPQHGKDLWKELEISERSWPRFTNAMLKCLGTHVEKASIVRSENSDKILQRPKFQECNIKYLGKLISIYYI